MWFTNRNESLYCYCYCDECGTAERDSRHWIKTVYIEKGEDLRLCKEIVDICEDSSCMNRNVKDDVTEMKRNVI